MLRHDAQLSSTFQVRIAQGDVIECQKRSMGEFIAAEAGIKCESPGRLARAGVSTWVLRRRFSPRTRAHEHAHEHAHAHTHTRHTMSYNGVPLTSCTATLAEHTSNMNCMLKDAFSQLNVHKVGRIL